jgi:hypothetical protein
VRELAVSYFHEYFLNNGKKTLRWYSRPFDLRRWNGDWVTAEGDLWALETAIDRSPHRPLVTRRQIAGLRRADPIERAAGKLEEWRGAHFPTSPPCAAAIHPLNSPHMVSTHTVR